MRYCSIDLETTGLDPERANIIEFGAVLDDLENQKPIDQLSRFHAYILPPYCDRGYEGDPFALSMHGAIFRAVGKRESGFRYLMPQELPGAYLEWLTANGYDLKKDRVTAAGKNFASFDLRFLRKWTPWEQVPMHHRVIDPASALMLPADRALPDMKECAKRAGLGEITVAHTAVDDALQVVQIVRAIATKQQNSLDSLFKTYDAEVLRMESPIDDTSDVVIHIPEIMRLIGVCAVMDHIKRKLFYAKKPTDETYGKVINDHALFQDRVKDWCSHFVGDIKYKELAASPRLLHALVGLTTEVGEMWEEVMRATIANRAIDLDNLQEEFGDHNWYSSLGRDELEKLDGNRGRFSLRSILMANMAKLNVRYSRDIKPNEYGADRDRPAELQAMADATKQGAAA